MKRIFEEPKLDCVMISTESIADNNGTIVDPSFGNTDIPSGWE